MSDPADVSAMQLSPLLTYVLRLADDNLILAQRLGELVSRMPELEEDIAVANIGLDHLGAARMLYAYASELDGSGEGADRKPGRSEDEFAMLRSEREFLNAVLVEQPNQDFAHVVVRQLLVDAYQVPMYEALMKSSDAQLVAIAAKAVKEARYHLDYSSIWVVRLGDGTSESHQRSQAALDGLWRFAADLFAADEVEHNLVAEGIAADPALIRPRFDQIVATVVARANLTIPEDPYERIGGRTGFHTEHLGHLLPEMQNLYRAHPGATW